MDTDQAELLRQITSFLEKYKIPYMITGAWSVVFYGRPRASHDIDFVVELKDKNIKKVLAAIAKLPFDKSRLGQLMEIASPEDTIIQKLRWYHEGKIEKHLIDAAFVYQIQKKNLDNEYLESWVDKLKLKRYFEELDKINLEEFI